MEEPQPDYTIEQLLVHGPLYAVLKVIKSVLESPVTHYAAANKLYSLFSQKREYVTDSTVDCYLKKFLLVVLKLPSSEEGKKTVFLEILDKLIFGEDSYFVSLLMKRTLIPSQISAEDAADVLCYLALKFHRQRNFQKFVHLLVDSVKTSKHSLSGFSLHPRVLECMSECAVKLPINQNLGLWNFICSVLAEDWTEDIKSEGDSPQPRVAAQVLAVLMLNIKLADYSIRNETMDEVLVLFNTVSDGLKMLSQTALKDPKGFTSPLLTLAFAYGELHQLLLLYSPLYAERQSGKAECQVSELKDEVWDFSFFHTYATNEQWLQLANDRTANVSLWAPLVLQKIRYLILFSGRNRNDKEKLLKKLIDYLMENFDCCQSLWLNNIKYILPFMAQKQMVMLGKKMIASPEIWKTVLSDQDVTERRTLQMSLICSLFGSIHDQSRKRKSEEDALPLSSGTLSVLRLFSMHLDFWVGSVDQPNKKVSVSLRQSAEHLQESMRQVESTTTTDRDLTELLLPLDILEYLPLEYFLGPVHSGCLMGLLSLLLSCHQEQIKSRIWMMIVRLLDNEKNSPLFEYFPCTEFMIWAVSNTKDLPDCALIFSTLFDEMLRSPKSSKESFVWIQTADLSATALPVTVLAIKKLIKHKKVDEKIFSIVRKRFIKTFEEGLETRLIDVVEGAHSLLEIYVEKSKPAKETTTEAVKPLKIKEMLKNLPKLMEAARKGLMSTDEAVGSASAELISLLLAHQQLLSKYVTKEIKMSTWDAYRQSSNPTRWDDRLLRQLISKCNLKEFYAITNAMIDDLQLATVKALDDEMPDELAAELDVRRISCFFRHLVSADLPSNEERFGVRLQVIQTALPLIQHLVLSVCRNYGSVSLDRVVRLAVPPMGIYLSLLNLSESFAYPHDLTSALHACLALPLNAEMSADHFESIFTVVYKTVHYLLTKHQEVAADRVPVLLQVYRRLMACTCSRSDSRRSAGDSEVASLTDAANRLARLASVINTQPLRYRRAAAYIIVDLLSDLKKQPLYPTVKQELTTALYHLMDLLDQHANRYLMAVLPCGIHELFRLEYEHYEKFYKFKGKV